MRTIILILTALFIIIGGCKKEDPIKQPPVKEVFIDNNLISYLIFKEGSYWVYKDSVSQQIDTVTVVNSSLNIREEKEYDSDTLVKYQTAGVHYTHSYSLRRSSCYINSIPLYIYQSLVPQEHL